VTAHWPPSGGRFWERASLVALLSLGVVVATARQLGPDWRPTQGIHDAAERTKTGVLSGSSVQPKPQNDDAAAAERRRRAFWALLLRDIARHPFGSSR
jgi:hypothetical protein